MAPTQSIGKGATGMQGRHYLQLVFILIYSAVASAQGKSQTKTFVVNQKAGQATVIQIDNRTYVDLAMLVQIANGSLGFQGSQINVVLPAPESVTPAATPDAGQSMSRQGLTRQFVIAGIETIAQMREWASTMANAIQQGYGITENWAAEYRGKAANSLNVASASASGDADRNALQLLTNEFQSVESWSDQLVQAKKQMDTAKYTSSSDALRNEPLSQKIISCGHFLGTMLGSSEFKDDPSCH